MKATLVAKRTRPLVMNQSEKKRNHSAQSESDSISSSPENKRSKKEKHDGDNANDHGSDRGIDRAMAVGMGLSNSKQRWVTAPIRTRALSANCSAQVSA